MKCIIIDDDKLSRNILEQFVVKAGGLELTASFADPIQALTYLKDNQTELIFLDVEMPEMSGLEFISSLNNATSQIILITAHEKFALSAFEYNVTDYILKPVRYTRFLKAVERAKEVAPSQQVNTIENDANSFFIKKSGSIVRINISDVVWVEALGDYIILNTLKQEKYTIHMTMKDIEAKLPSKDYIRVHRSFIVRIDKIDSIEDNAISYNEKLIPIGKSYKEQVLKRLEIL